MASLLQQRRRLGTDSGDLRRAARRVEREGGNPNDLLMAAEKVRQPGIRSYEERVAGQAFEERMQRGLMETKRRASLGGAAESRMGGVPSPSGSSAPAPTAAPSVAPTGGQPVSPSPAPSVDPNFVGPPKPASLVESQRLAAETALRRSYREQEDALTRGNAPFDGTVNSSADITRKQAEIEDRYNKNRNISQREPGNLAELNARDAKKIQSPPSPNTPLQKAFDEAMARRAAVTEPEVTAAPKPEIPMTVGGVPQQQKMSWSKDELDKLRAANAPNPAPVASTAPETGGLASAAARSKPVPMSNPSMTSAKEFNSLSRLLKSNSPSEVIARRNAAYNAQPDLPGNFAAPNSLANRAYKAVRARFTNY